MLYVGLLVPLGLQLLQGRRRVSVRYRLYALELMLAFVAGFHHFGL